MKEPLNELRTLQNDPYWPPNTKEDLWESYCFQFYWRIGVLKGFENLLLAESTAIMKRKKSFPKEDTLRAVATLAYAEIGSIERRGWVVNESDEVFHMLYNDLLVLGRHLLKVGVSLKELVGMIGTAKFFHTKFAKQIALSSTSLAYTSRVILSAMESKAEHRERYKSAKRIIKLLYPSLQVKRGKTGLIDLDKVLELVRELHGEVGFWLLLDLLKPHWADEEYQKQRQLIRATFKILRDDLVVQVVKILEAHRITGVFQTAARLVNGLLAYPLYSIERSSLTYRSRGEQTIYSQYKAALRQMQQKKGQKRTRVTASKR